MKVKLNGLWSENFMLMFLCKNKCSINSWCFSIWWLG